MPLYRQTYVQTSGEEKIVDVEASRPCAARDAAANYFNAWLAGEGRSSDGWRLMSQEIVPDLVDAIWPDLESPVAVESFATYAERTMAEMDRAFGVETTGESEPEDEPFSI